jgi:very-short-patch-repair endonuclease/predicted transcriptional regulator of viral defense system
VWSKNPNNSRKSTTPDAVIARLAARQHGMVTRVQLLAAGLSAADIDYRVRIGRLVRIHNGVYAVGHLPPSPHARAMAAVLACGPGAVLSHRSAGALWSLGPWWSGQVDVTVRAKRSRQGIRVHRSSTLTRADTTRHYGIPVTSPARTLLDLADVLDDKALARAVNEARLAHRTTQAELAALLTRSPGRATTRLTPFLEQPGGPTRSTFEDAFLKFVKRHGLPTPEVNQVVAGHEVDSLWRDQRLVVELDSRTHHDTDDAFEVDRERDADLLNAGFSVARVTSRRLRRDAAREAERLRRILDRRSTTPGPPA